MQASQGTSSFKKSISFLIYGFAVLTSLWSSSTWAALSFSVSGSSQDIVVSGNTIKVYGGIANPSACTSGTETCDTCVGGINIPCNKSSVLPTTSLTISVSSSTTGIDGLTVSAAKDSDNSTALSGGVGSTVSGGGYNYHITWGKLCDEVFSQTTSDCGLVAGGVYKAGTFYFGPKKTDGKFAETVTVEFYVSAIDGTADYYTGAKACPASESTACHFTIFPGDEKVYVDEFLYSWGTDTPTTSTTAPLKSVVFFSKPNPTSDANVTQDQAILATITNADTSDFLTIKAGDDPLSDYRIKDLENEQRYCFVMAIQDITGNIFKYTPTSDYTVLRTGETAADGSALCATPSQVFGVLADKECFISTAAFGSRMDPHVQRFRDFRNQFLVHHPLGEKFIHFYYEYGPSAAAVIKKSPTLRFFVRSLLWPALGFVEVALQWGFVWALMIFSLGFILVYQLIQRLKAKLKLKSELFSGRERGQA